MMTIEVFTSAALGSERRAELGHRILADFFTSESAPEAVLDANRALTNVVVHEPATWVTRGDEPRYVVRVTVPGSWNNKEFGAFAVERLTALVASVEDDPTRLLREPHCQVQIIGLKEHAVGTLGKVMTATDIARLLTDGYRATADERTPEPGTAIDPVCGMTVDLATAKLTLEHDGTLYAFCAPVCHRIFSEELAAG